MSPYARRLHTQTYRRSKGEKWARNEIANTHMTISRSSIQAHTHTHAHTGVWVEAEDDGVGAQRVAGVEGAMVHKGQPVLLVAARVRAVQRGPADHAHVAVGVGLRGELA